MGKRLLPFRQYNEHDVVNMFALEDASVNDNITGFGAGDAGVFVKVTAGNLDLDPVTYGTSSYLGKTDYPFVGANGYPSVSLKVAPAASGDIKPLGLTLWETAKYDENGQKLIYYPQKAIENQVLLPGQSVPVLTRGIVTLTSKAIDDSASFAVGSGFKLSANAGKVTGAAVTDTASLGTILGTGVRGNNGATLPDLYSGKFAVVKLGL
jgi:hypothetical protein